MADSQANINNPSPGKRVLIAALDWGLGHATRCIPLIRKYRDEGWEVTAGASGKGILILREAFPDLTLIEFPAYDVAYAKSKAFFTWKLLFQSVKIKQAVRKEHLFLQELLRREKFDLIISDNRFGLHHPSVDCIFMTHQLAIKTGTMLGDWVARRINFGYINRFRKCFIPDFAGEENLAGELSHPKHLPKTQLEYIGPLSRFKEIRSDLIYDAVFVCSGPEPARSNFESVFLREIKKQSDLKFVLLRGLADDNLIIPANAKVLKHAKAEEMNLLFAQAKLIVAPAGYSTIMDLHAAKRPAVLIPTPGQKEQEYLAKYHSVKNAFQVSDLNRFRICDFIGSGDPRRLR